MPEGPKVYSSPEDVAADYLGRSIDVVSCISRGWNLVLEYPAPLIGGALLVLCSFLVLSFVPVLGWLATLVLQGPLFAGLYLMFLRRIRGETIVAWDVFRGVSDPHVLQLFLTAFISSLLTAIGMVLCILPGIFLAVCYVFVLPLAIDKRWEFWLAMEVSRRVVQAQWLTFFVLALVCLLITMAGVLACFVGLIVAIPVCIAAVAYAYEDVFGTKTAA